MKTNYKKKHCSGLLEFFNRPPYRQERLVKTFKNGESDEKLIETPNDLPLLSSFANSLSVTLDTLHEWGEKHKEFASAMQRAKAYQENMIVNNAARGHYNSTFAVFLLKVLLEWRDKSDSLNNKLNPDNENLAEILDQMVSSTAIGE
jgi:hypothetical protein